MKTCKDKAGNFHRLQVAGILAGLLFVFGFATTQSAVAQTPSARAYATAN